MEIERDYYLKELVDRIDNQLIKIVTGIRRCGKSYLLNIILFIKRTWTKITQNYDF